MAAEPLTTKGRGRYDRDKLYDKPKKDERTSGCAPSNGIGSEPSIGKIPRPPNAYCTRISSGEEDAMN